MENSLEFAPQGSVGWMKSRLGRVTASRVADVVATVKSGGYGSSRANYMAQLLCERLTGIPTENFVSAAMQNGTELEPEGRTAYSFYTGYDVALVGFIQHPTIPMAGASPDGAIDSDGLLEIKCPQLPAALDTLLTEKVPAKYLPQIQFQMAVTGRQWVDYVSYNPRLPVEMSLFISRVYRDQKAIDTLEHEVRLFLQVLDEKERLLREKFLMKDAA